MMNVNEDGDHDDGNHDDGDHDGLFIHLQA